VGTGPFTYNFWIFNSITNTMVANQLVTNALTSNSYSFQFTNAFAYNTIKANVIITDSATNAMSINSILSSQMTINTLLGTPTISPLAPNTLDGNQYFLFTATLPAGNVGTGPFTYNFWIFNSITNTMVANQLVTNALTSNSYSFQFTNAFAYNTIKANVIITDSATNAMFVNSIISSNMAFNSPPSVIFTTLGTSIVPGQGLTFTVNIPVGGGIGPFVANVFSNGAYFSTLYLTPNSFLNSNTAVFSSANPGSYALDVVATDLGTSAPFLFSSSYVAVTVTPAAGGMGAIVGSNGGASPPASAATPVTTTIPATTTISQMVINSTTPAGGVTASVTSQAPVSVVLGPAQASVTIFTSSPTAVSEQVQIQNYTSQSPPAPPNYQKAIAVNILVSAVKNLTVNATLHYNCSIPSAAVSPFILNASTLNWQKISSFTVNQTSCSVSFSVPIDPVVALLFTKPINATTITTSVSTITSSTTIASTVKPAAGGGPTTLNIEIAAGIVVAIVLAALFVYRRNRGKGNHALKRHEPAKSQEHLHGRAPSER
jgi:hypothetical protein